MRVSKSSFGYCVIILIVCQHQGETKRSKRKKLGKQNSLDQDGGSLGNIEMPVKLSASPNSQDNRIEVQETADGDTLASRRKSSLSDTIQCLNTLNSKLLKFYKDRVKLKGNNQQVAKIIVGDFLKVVWPSIQSSSLGLRLTTYKPVGSMSENLSRAEISDFDFHLPIDGGESELSPVDIPKLPGYKSIRCEGGTFCLQFGKIEQNMRHVDPVAIIQYLQSRVSSAVTNTHIHPPCTAYRPGYQGPTISVELDCLINSKSTTLRVEFVPLLKTSDSRKFVAKTVDRGVDHMHTLSWRESFTDGERALIAKQPKHHLDVLRLMKHFVKHTAKPMNYLSSFMLKNVYFHMIGFGYPLDTKQLCDQLRDFLDELRTFAKNRKLPLYFNHNVNLFSPFKSSTIQNLENYLTTILQIFKPTINEWIGPEPVRKDEL